MIYRHDLPSDWPAMVEYLGTVDEFYSVDPTTLGGHWIIAVDGDGRVHGTVWCFADPPHAYVGYWAADGSVVASKLLICFHQFAAANGIRYLHSTIAKDNTAAVRMAVDGIGAVASEPYYRIYKELSSGPQDHADNDDTGSGRTGE